MACLFIWSLCYVLGSNLRKLLHVEEKNKGRIAFLVEQFLLSDKTKSIDKSINLPPVSALVLKQYIINRANKHFR